MPCYPALALLIGAAIAKGGRAVEAGDTRHRGGSGASVSGGNRDPPIAVRGLPAPGDISTALNPDPDIYAAYTLSLGHMGDLTLRAFAYLRLPLAVAAVAFLIGAVSGWRLSGKRAAIGAALMMTLFFHAARLALVTFGLLSWFAYRWPKL